LAFGLENGPVGQWDVPGIFERRGSGGGGGRDPGAGESGVIRGQVYFV